MIPVFSSEYLFAFVKVLLPNNSLWAKGSISVLILNVDTGKKATDLPTRRGLVWTVLLVVGGACFSFVGCDGVRRVLGSGPLRVLVVLELRSRDVQQRLPERSVY
jgi:hypothetical protein